MPKAKVTTNAIDSYISMLRDLGKMLMISQERQCMRELESLRMLYEKT